MADVVGSISPVSDLFLSRDRNRNIIQESLVSHFEKKLVLKPREINEAELRKVAYNFDEANFMGDTQFGKLYRGTIFSDVGGTRHVVVKKWDDEQIYLYLRAVVEYDPMFQEEIRFLRDPIAASHPNLVKLLGYFPGDDVKGVVYDLNPNDTLHNLATKDCFTWLLRIKSLLGFARLLEFLHSQPKPYILMNIDAAHIVLDQEWNPILVDFSLMSGGILGDRENYKTMVPMVRGYIDSELGPEGYRWDELCHDVYAFGVLILGVIAKRMLDREDLVRKEWTDDWARKEYKTRCCLVDKSLTKEDPFYYESDGCALTALAMECIGEDAEHRPSMKEVVERLQSLLIVKKHMCWEKKERSS